MFSEDVEISESDEDEGGKFRSMPSFGFGVLPVIFLCYYDWIALYFVFCQISLFVVLRVPLTELFCRPTFFPAGTFYRLVMCRSDV